MLLYPHGIYISLHTSFDYDHMICMQYSQTLLEIITEKRLK